MKRIQLCGLCILLLSLFSVAVSCGGGGIGDLLSSGLGIPGDITGSSVAQRAFSSVRGSPSLFTVGFVTETLDSAGKVIPLDPPRRIESWAYPQNQGKFTSALFDNGYFVKEVTLGGAASIQPTNLNPSQFNLGMNRSSIIGMMGAPSCEETRQFAGKSFTFMRYNPSVSVPAATVVLENGALSSVTAGYAMVDSSHTSADLCVLQ